LGDAARAEYKSLDGKFPDVVAKKMDGTFALSEGKGTDIGKMIKQFEAAKGKLPHGAIVSEQEVVVERLVNQPVDGGVLRSPGPGYGVDADGYLLNATAYVDLSKGLPPRVSVNGRPVRVIVIEAEGNIIGTNIVGDSRSPLPK
jgi:hypothetical protein